MPVSKPGTLPDWATAAVGADMTAPSGGKQAQGWTSAEFPPHNFFNWWQNLVGQWVDWLNAFESQAHTWSALQTFSLGLAVTGGLSGDDVLVDSGNANAGTLTKSLRFGSAGGTEGIASKRTAGGNQNGLDFYTNSLARLQIANDGTVTVVGAGKLSAPAVKTSAGAYTNSFSAYGNPVLTYWKDATGKVHVEGAVAHVGDGNGLAFFTLPAGYQPLSGSYVFPVLLNDATLLGCLFISSGGAMSFQRLSGGTPNITNGQFHVSFMPNL